MIRLLSFTVTRTCRPASAENGVEPSARILALPGPSLILPSLLSDSRPIVLSFDGPTVKRSRPVRVTTMRRFVGGMQIPYTLVHPARYRWLKSPPWLG
jgi:hypothetical protein